MAHTLPSFFHLHLISDATGETLTTIAKAASVQYAQMRPIEHVHPLVRTARQLKRVLQEIEQTPGITRLLDRLEAKGWVERQRTPEDRRQVRCWITAAGLSLLGELDAPMDAADDGGLGDLPLADVETLIALLDRIRHGLRQHDTARLPVTLPTPAPSA